MTTKTTCPFGNTCEIKTEEKHEKCMLYIHIRGTDPQTGEEKDQWDCALALTPIMLIENSNMQRHTAAAVESFRNEMVTQNNQLAAVMLHTSGNSKLLEGAEDAENERPVS